MRNRTESVQGRRSGRRKKGKKERRSQSKREGGHRRHSTERTFPARAFRSSTTSTSAPKDENKGKNWKTVSNGSKKTTPGRGKEERYDQRRKTRKGRGWRDFSGHGKKLKIDAMGSWGGMHGGREEGNCSRETPRQSKVVKGGIEELGKQKEKKKDEGLRKIYSQWTGHVTKKSGGKKKKKKKRGGEGAPSKFTQSRGVTSEHGPAEVWNNRIQREREGRRGKR